MAALASELESQGWHLSEVNNYELLACCPTTLNLFYSRLALPWPAQLRRWWSWPLTWTWRTLVPAAFQRRSTGARWTQSLGPWCSWSPKWVFTLHQSDTRINILSRCEILLHPRLKKKAKLVLGCSKCHWVMAQWPAMRLKSLPVRSSLWKLPLAQRSGWTRVLLRWQEASSSCTREPLRSWAGEWSPLWRSGSLLKVLPSSPELTSGRALGERWGLLLLHLDNIFLLRVLPSG